MVIVGGGIAGLTLGIGLRQHGVPVTLWEAGHYPRHRVCGEFISGRGQEVLARIGLLGLLGNAGICLARTAAFFERSTSIPPRPLPQPGLCISRFVLDRVLAGEFQRIGGELEAGERWHGHEAPGVVHASGRRIEPKVDGYRWIGLKAHASNVFPLADMELHFLSSGYVGVCRLPGNIFNVCGLFRSETSIPDLATHWQQWLRGSEGSPLHDRLVHARFEESSFCTVAGLDTRGRKPEAQGECRIGDALTMIPPMTGNGMSMALESAELALGPLVKYSRGELEWPQACRKIARACNGRFSRRLLWARWLQQIAFQPLPRRSLMRLAGRFEPLSRALFAWTR